MTRQTIRRSARALAVLLLVTVAGGCATPVGVSSLGRNYGYDQIDRCALNSKEYSSFTAHVLHRYDLEGTSSRSAKAPSRKLRLSFGCRSAASVSGADIPIFPNRCPSTPWPNPLTVIKFMGFLYGTGMPAWARPSCSSASGG